jgi:hypothetical protein
MARWPSGLRRYVQVVVRKGVGSNPTLVSFFLLAFARCAVCAVSVKNEKLPLKAVWPNG